MRCFDVRGLNVSGLEVKVLEMGHLEVTGPGITDQEVGR